MILGHKREIEYLKKISQSKRLPHALLFSGQRGLGKKKIAMEFISWIFERPIFNHPDFILIEPEEKEIKIDQIRELKEKLSLKPFLAKLKAAIINKAEAMTLEAQNCFLKTLEEPSNSIIILISENPNLLLPTIISRCEKIKFYPVKRKEIEDYLRERGLNEEKIRRILNISLFRPEVAWELAEDERKFKSLENLKEILEKIKKMNLAERFQLVANLLEEFKISEILEIWMLSLREKLIYQGETKDIPILKEIQKVYFLVSTTNVDQKLALENLFLKI